MGDTTLWIIKEVLNKEKIKKLLFYLFLEKIMTFNPEIPYAKIKIIKSNMEGEKEFIVTPDGNFKN